MKIKLLLRLVYAVLIIAVYKLWGLDWVIVTSLVFIVADLDSIADVVVKHRKDNCEK